MHFFEKLRQWIFYRQYIVYMEYREIKFLGGIKFT